MSKQIFVRLLESFFHHRWLYLLPFILMMGIGGLYLFTTKPKYASHAIIYVQKESLLASLNAVGNSDSNIWTTPAQATTLEINELLQTDAFIRAVIKQTDLESKMTAGEVEVANLLKDTRSSLWVYSLGDNQIQINALDKNPVVASQLVNGIIESYIQWKLNGSRGQGEAAQAFFAGLIKNYQADLDVARQAMKDYLVAHPAPLRGDRPDLEQLEIKRLQGDIDLATTRLSGALEKEENARLALAQTESEARQTYAVVDAPQPPLRPETSRKQMALKLGIFIVVGLILSLTAIIGDALLDGSVRFSYDVTNKFNLPVLAMVPEVNSKLQKRVLFRKKNGSKPEESLLDFEN